MIIIWILLILLFVSFGMIVFIGAPYVPTDNQAIEGIFSVLKIRKGSTVVDLGSGDGRVLMSASKHGYKAIGYELNPVLALVSKYRLREYPKAKVVITDYWKADLSKADVVFIFSAAPYMHRLNEKFKNELKPGTVVISYAFSFESKKIDQKIGPANIYIF